MNLPLSPVTITLCKAVVTVLTENGFRPRLRIEIYG